MSRAFLEVPQSSLSLKVSERIWIPKPLTCPILQAFGLAAE